MVQISKQQIDAFQQNPTVTDPDLEKTLREKARENIAQKLLILVGGLYALFLLVGAVLVFFLKIQFRDLLDLILALGVMSGFLGTAINFYFKN